MSACEMCGKNLVDCTTSSSLRLCGSCTTIYIAWKDMKIKIHEQISELIKENKDLRSENKRLKEAVEEAEHFVRLVSSSYSQRSIEQDRVRSWLSKYGKE